jgi:hypothetical protein
MTDLRALLDLLDQLKRQHQAGVNETFGQLDRLFGRDRQRFSQQSHNRIRLARAGPALRVSALRR